MTNMSLRPFESSNYNMNNPGYVTLSSHRCATDRAVDGPTNGTQGLQSSSLVSECTTQTSPPASLPHPATRHTPSHLSCRPTPARPTKISFRSKISPSISLTQARPLQIMLSSVFSPALSDPFPIPKNHSSHTRDCTTSKQGPHKPEVSA